MTLIDFDPILPYEETLKLFNGDSVRMQLDKEDVIRLFTGLGDSMRLEIVFLLGEHERLNVGEIAAHFHLSRPAISHHLKVLRDARILKSQKIATEVYYWLDIASLSERLRVILTLLEACPVAAYEQESG